MHRSSKPIELICFSCTFSLQFIVLYIFDDMHDVQIFNAHIAHAHIKIEFCCLISLSQGSNEAALLPILLSQKRAHWLFNICLFRTKWICHTFIVYIQHWLGWNDKHSAQEWTQYVFYDSTGFVYLEKSSKFNESRIHTQTHRRECRYEITDTLSKHTKLFFVYSALFEESVCFWKLIFHRIGMYIYIYIYIEYIVCISNMCVYALLLLLLLLCTSKPIEYRRGNYMMTESNIDT